MKIENFNDIMKKCFGSRLINVPAEEEVKQTEEEKEYTCCNVEITQEIKDNNICPKCLEHL